MDTLSVCPHLYAYLLTVPHFIALLSMASECTDGRRRNGRDTVYGHSEGPGLAC